ncbi:PilZ domain-containing protein [Beggiatoa alba]|nr:PilZ domain-containing protein [Beggiatoa alba]
MRNYIRHPADIPIEIVIPEDNTLALSQNLDASVKIETMENVSFGGLMFQSSIPYVQNKVIIIRMNFINPQFEAPVVVNWCLKSGGNYLVGLQFIDENDEFMVRMVEQVCHIMHYRKQVLATEGREIDNEEAAREWIEQYAKDFPR